MMGNATRKNEVLSVVGLCLVDRAQEVVIMLLSSIELWTFELCEVECNISIRIALRD